MSDLNLQKMKILNSGVRGSGTTKKLHNLKISPIKEQIHSNSTIDPSFKTQQTFTRTSVFEVEDSTLKSTFELKLNSNDYNPDDHNKIELSSNHKKDYLKELSVSESNSSESIDEFLKNSSNTIREQFLSKKKQKNESTPTSIKNDTINLNISGGVKQLQSPQSKKVVRKEGIVQFVEKDPQKKKMVLKMIESRQGPRSPLKVPQFKSELGKDDYFKKVFVDKKT